MEIIVSKNCGPTTFFRAILKYLLISEENETEKYIFGLCFPMVPAATGRPPRKRDGGRGKRADELGRQRQAQMLAHRILCWVGKKMKRRDEDKRPIYLSTSCCFQKLDEMEKNGNYSPTKEEENDMARRDKLAASWAMTKVAKPRTSTVVINKCLAMQSQRSVRDPSVLLIHQWRWWNRIVHFQFLFSYSSNRHREDAIRTGEEQ